jgi:hypothetical protein
MGITMNAALQAMAGYFSTVAQVSGGLLGLVFVAISFNTKVLGENGNPALRDLARQTFADFLVVLMVSLFGLFPVGVDLPMGVLLISIAATGTLRIARGFVLSVRAGERRPVVLNRFGLSLLGHAGLFAAGAVALRSELDVPQFQTFLLAATLILLIAGSRSAWILFVHE